MSTLYLEHFGLAEAPFSITPNPQYFYAGGARGQLLRALRYAVCSEEGVIVVTGEVGTGKTMLARMLLADLPADVDAVYLANPAFDRDEIVSAIARDLGLARPVEGTMLEQLQRELVARHAAGRRVVLLIDEAHTMDAAALDEVRRLSNVETAQHKLVGIVLFGQPELDALLARPDLRQLRDRVVQRFSLPPLPRGCVPEYLHRRLCAAGYRGPMPFARAALWRIQRASGGRSRRINLIADKALLACFARAGTRVSGADVSRALRDLEAPRMSRMALRAAATAAGVGVLLGAATLLATRLAAPAANLAADAPAPAAGAPTTNGTSMERR